ncbi:ribosome small subunit-dependent GTPase A [Hydrogenovibrio marinus]|uniref:Small ribosomal subunit biogenesis GTPase RsgA n=1 Tax=Hydrogenovibrio marinus TaxID=28885 RepID=A0A066ZZP1_HYDMR|nr:ribosome small subunit-dependent GTPase A [Hydrogenovibrio marinus]KDN95580.1 GTP-binding protein EngC [Hydrogenovibrio marinus]BBN60074.1 putative ribosome biogenesis GTPase RsgA [Hydrogenovibrio marinus]
MSKRKLTKQQQKRVKEKRLEPLTDSQAASSKSTQNENNVLLGVPEQGLVITNFGKRILVEANNGSLVNCAVRQHLGKLVAGDIVTWQTDIEENTGVVTSLTPRKQELSRPGFRGQTRMVASNIDLLVIVAPITPGIHPDMIDRYLVVAHQLQLPTILVINKTDLIQSDEQWEMIAETLIPYDELNIEIYPVSSETQDGLEDLREALIAKNSVFVGPSGAGKSSLIKALIPDIEIKVNNLSESTGLGKHTTTNSILYHLPPVHGEENAGNIIDSPGVRLFSPAPCELHELEQAYPDFQPFLGKCKFNNCTHQNEPQCAIRDAVENGGIHYSRYHSFQRLLEEFSNSDNQGR